MLQGPENPDSARNFAIAIVSDCGHIYAYETAYICSIVAYVYDYAKKIISFGRKSVKLADLNIVLQGPVQDSTKLVICGVCIVDASNGRWVAPVLRLVKHRFVKWLISYCPTIL